MDNSTTPLNRRRFLQVGGTGYLALQGASSFSADAARSAGLVVGQLEGAQAGNDVLAGGGNAVDAAVAAALVSAVVSISNCGIGGYGGHMVIASPGGQVTSIDFNSAAPAAAREDMFPLDGQGKVRGGVNTYGWLAAGVPGTLAGLQLALDRFGTRRLSQVVGPAIRYAREGFPITRGMAQAIGNAAEQFRRDEASARLFFRAGKPLAEGETYRNPELAAMLEQLAADNSVASFYRGPIARQIAQGFQRNGDLVTEQDLAAYEAHEVEPLSLSWRGSTLHTAPLTAGGLSVLQTLATLKSLAWENWDHKDPRTTHGRVEATRLAWHDRLSLLGDPNGSDVPVARLLSPAHADASAERVKQALAEKKLIPGNTDGRTAGGTIHLTAVDQTGMMVALTLTHGEGFGARVTVDGLGLLLGHGMSRFEPRPGHPNSPRPGCRPLNNMCPTILVRDGRPVLALGATGGRRIPNTMCDVLSALVGRSLALEQAFATPRLHTEGDAMLQLGKGWQPADVDYLKRVGYTVKDGPGANLNAIARDALGGVLTHVPR